MKARSDSTVRIAPVWTVNMTFMPWILSSFLCRCPHSSWDALQFVRQLSVWLLTPVGCFVSCIFLWPFSFPSVLVTPCQLEWPSLVWRWVGENGEELFTKFTSLDTVRLLISSTGSTMLHLTSLVWLFWCFLSGRLLAKFPFWPQAKQIPSFILLVLCVSWVLAYYYWQMFLHILRHWWN